MHHHDAEVGATLPISKKTQKHHYLHGKPWSETVTPQDLKTIINNNMPDKTFPCQLKLLLWTW